MYVQLFCHCLFISSIRVCVYLSNCVCLFGFFVFLSAIISVAKICIFLIIIYFMTEGIHNRYIKTTSNRIFFTTVSYLRLDKTYCMQYNLVLGDFQKQILTFEKENYCGLSFEYSLKKSLDKKYILIIFIIIYNISIFNSIAKTTGLICEKNLSRANIY